MPGSQFPWRTVALLALAGGALSAQNVRVYSEFVRVGPDGEVVAPDKVEKPREIISPAAQKNAFVTVRVAVEAPADTIYYIHLGQNPEKLVEMTLYQELYEPAGDGAFIPDKVQKVSLPHGAKLSEGQKVQTYLLDIFIPPKTPMTRIRLEVQLNVGDGWTIYPMELRVRDRTGPGGGRPLGPMPAVKARADAAILAPLREYVCSDPLSKRGPVALDTARGLMLRNIRQDIAMAREREKEEGAGVQAMLLKAGGWPSSEAFCQSKGLPANGPEWWLRVRNYLYQGLPVR
jgi:hypothetical protein